MAEKPNDLRIPFAEWLFRMSEADVPYQARALAVYAVAFRVTSNEELARLVGMDTKGIADKTYNKWKRYLSDHGWVIVRQVTVGRMTSVEVDPALNETPVTFTDLKSRDARKFYGSSNVTITDMVAVEVAAELEKVTAELEKTTAGPVEVTDEAKEKIPHTPLKENNKNNKLASEESGEPPALAGLNGSAEPMLDDIVRWMVGGDIAAARKWLANFIHTHGQEVVRDSYQKLGTDMLTGSLVASPLQTWSKIAARMRNERRSVNASTEPKSSKREERLAYAERKAEEVAAQQKAGRRS